MLRITSLDSYLDITNKGEPFSFISNLVGEMLKMERVLNDRAK